ncbi:unnamed protein product [Gongylonema pulchrum]|uniref:Uncharacterized protein n=1 Tax=Gongylonema pulchrum TaxID=637853 RepID=A0A183DDX6_9BILA|nr:unnamed protein product [Gongylonema pulchrum]
MSGLLQARRRRQALEHDRENLRQTLENTNSLLAASENEKKTKQEQIESLRDELNRQDETIAKSNKDKKQQEELCRKLADDLQAQEDRKTKGSRTKMKIEYAIDEIENRIERLIPTQQPNTWANIGRALILSGMQEEGHQLG